MTPVIDEAPRLPGLDLLRGLCALAVAGYHAASWTGVAQLHTWGSYAVYAFFVLSGASMVIAYADRFAQGFSIGRFLALRLVRLLPLFLLVLAATVAWRLSQGRLDGERLGLAYLNLLFLFGLGNPGATSQVVGGWSLGIEFLFYLLFPVALALTHSRYWLLALLIAFSSQHVFVNLVLGEGTTLAAAAGTYTQFLAFVFYFLAGCALGRGVRASRLRPHRMAAPVLFLLGGLLTIASPPTIEAGLTGLAGIGLSLATVALVAASASLRLGSLGGGFARVFGGASYGVYLLHPLVYPPVQAFARWSALGPAWVIALTVALATVLALLLERWFEQPIQRHFKGRLQWQKGVQ